MDDLAANAEWDDSAWAILGVTKLRWGTVSDPTDWSVKHEVGKHRFRGVTGDPIGFRRGPRGGTYIVYAEREIRIRPYWISK